MIAPTQIRKPENWQDFERLCKKLWGEIWNCSDTIQRNGRNGQNQHGVDIYGIPKGQSEYYGIQCKGKDEYTHSQLTKEEIDNEITKAKTFKPSLKRFIFATTANKDALIEEYIRIKNIENINEGSFEIYLASWEDIVDLLMDYRNTFNWYINNCQYKDSSDVSVTIDGKTECTIHPQYYRTKKIYELSPNLFGTLLKTTENLKQALSFPAKVDYRWVKLYIRVDNIGNTVISDYKLYLNFEEEGIEETSTMIHYPDFRLTDFQKEAIYNRIEKTQEVYKYSDCEDLFIEPKERILVQTDSRSFKIGIKPKDGASKIIMHWDFKSKDYNKQGTIVINVEPLIEEREQIIQVNTIKELKDEEFVLEPKIIIH
jgi:hypothetical protein